MAHGYDGPPGAAEAAARLVAQLTDHAVIALDPHGRIVSWNEGARRLKGYVAADAIGKNFSMFYTRSDRATGLPFALLEDAREHGSASHSGFRVRQDGTEFWADSVITALHDDDGILVGFAKVTRDLTDRHELELALARSEERFRSLVEQVVDYAILVLDDGGTIVSWNAGAERLKGYTAEQALGCHFSMFYTDDDRAAGLPERLLEAARVDGHVQDSGWRVRLGGSRFWANVVITALHDDRGHSPASPRSPATSPHSTGSRRRASRSSTPSPTTSATPSPRSQGSPSWSGARRRRRPTTSSSGSAPTPAGWSR